MTVHSADITQTSLWKLYANFWSIVLFQNCMRIFEIGQMGQFGSMVLFFRSIVLFPEYRPIFGVLSYFRSLVLFRHGICIHMHLRTLFRQHSECWHSECCLKETHILSKETYILSKETLILSTINANVQMRRAPWRKRNAGECVCICITRTSFWMNEFRTSRLEWRAQNDFWMSRFEFWILCEHVSLNDSFRIDSFWMSHDSFWMSHDSFFVSTSFRLTHSEWVIQTDPFWMMRSERTQNDVLN